MDFAKRQLTKQGWKDGSGLGKAESGIKEPVKVKIKNDNKGVGHDSGAEFTFHWWDHVFNKAASNIDVTHTEAGVEIKNSKETKRSKQKSRSYDNKAMLYGQFVKGATLSGGTETVEESMPETQEDDDAPIKHALVPDNEEEIFKRCEGRTAHKGARHGLKANGKLQRIEYQEQLLLDKLKGKTTNQGQGQCSSVNLNQSESASADCETDISPVEENSKKKKKRKNKTKSMEVEIVEQTAELDTIQPGEMPVDSVEVCNTEVKKEKKKKKKKSCNKSVAVVDDLSVADEDVHQVSCDGEDVSEDVTTDVKLKQKKKKRKHVDDGELEIRNVENSSDKEPEKVREESGRKSSKKRRKTSKD